VSGGGESFSSGPQSLLSATVLRPRLVEGNAALRTLFFFERPAPSLHRLVDRVAFFPASGRTDPRS
jgi:hypothetical protein